MRTFETRAYYISHTRGTTKTQFAEETDEPVMGAAFMVDRGGRQGVCAERLREFLPLPYDSLLDIRQARCTLTEERHISVHSSVGLYKKGVG